MNPLLIQTGVVCSLRPGKLTLLHNVTSITFLALLLVCILLSLNYIGCRTHPVNTEALPQFIASLKTPTKPRRTFSRNPSL